MSTKNLLFTGGVLIAVVALVVLVAFLLPHKQSVSGDITPPSPEILAQVQASKGFQYLVVYTETGFQSSTITVHKGETVRWANNSSHDLWIADTLKDTTVACDGSILNSCKLIRPGHFWEYTFTAIGTVQYKDTYKAEHTGIIVVTPQTATTK